MDQRLFIDYTKTSQSADSQSADLGNLRSTFESTASKSGGKIRQSVVFLFQISITFSKNVLKQTQFSIYIKISDNSCLVFLPIPGYLQYRMTDTPSVDGWQQLSFETGLWTSTKICHYKTDVDYSFKFFQLIHWT